MLKIAVVSPICERRSWPRTACFHRRGFTLVELLVVIAIIGTLIALLLPAIQAARESGRRASCANNIKQLALGVESHKTSLGHFPTGGWNEKWLGDKDRGADWRQPGGWCFTILPYIDAKNLYDSVSTILASTNMPLFVCPTRRGTGLVPAGVTGPTGIAAGPWMHTDYAGNRGSYASTPPSPTTADVARETTFGPIGYTLPTSYPSTPSDLLLLQTGLQAAGVTLNTSQVPPLSGAAVATGGVIFAGSSVLPVSIRDGTSNTYLIAEKYVPRSSYGVGTLPGQGDAQCAYVGDSADTLRGGQALPQSDATPITSVLYGVFGSAHPGVFNAAMCDGSVRSVSFDIDARIHFLLAAKADRQVGSLD